MSEPRLILDTSGRAGVAGLETPHGVTVVHLDEARRHARDLASAVGKLLADAGVPPTGVKQILVGVGPGSYTGLRVGLAFAKTFAYAAGCELVPVPTFAAVAARVPGGPPAVCVFADALKGLVFAQTFHRDGGAWAAADELRIRTAEDAFAEIPLAAAVTGPGLAAHLGRVPPGCVVVPEGDRGPDVAGMLAAARGIRAATREELFALEPLYLRGSSAEEQAAKAATSRPSPASASALPPPGTPAGPA